MKTIFKIDIQNCLRDSALLNLSNDIKRALIEELIKEYFLNLNEKTLQYIFIKDKTPYPINMGKEVNQDLFSVSVKVRFIKEGKKPYKEILVYGMDELKTLTYSRFKIAIDEQILKIDVNTIISLFIIIKYKY